MSEPSGEPLTRDQVADLPDGTPVVIVWSGGNGPHRYVVKLDRGSLYASMPQYPRDNYYHRRIDFVGPAKPWTRVWLDPSSDPVNGEIQR